MKLLCFAAVVAMAWLGDGGAARAQPFQRLSGNCGTAATGLGTATGFVDQNGNLCVATTGIGAAPVAPSGALTLVAGGTAQPLAAIGTVAHGCQILNPLSTAQQGVTAESIFINLIGTAVAAAAGQSFEVVPGATFTCPGGTAGAISWIAATTGHKITAMVF